MKWIEKILQIDPYTVTCLWNDKKVRVIDLSEFLLEKAKNPKNSYAQLTDKKRFLQAKCDGTTIYWEKGVIMKETDGTENLGPLDIDPDFLFELCASS
ncbi:MAG: DUF2442 domain-containing protein [Bacteroidetes bacterium]|nr:DUF2442 domain-containing protein [Bacteroidota bacterium]MBU1719089.1 DUF2442 domain-containing protein [Bacteroidota bacterium]